MNFEAMADPFAGSVQYSVQGQRVGAVDETTRTWVLAGAGVLGMVLSVVTWGFAAYGVYKFATRKRRRGARKA